MKFAYLLVLQTPQMAKLLLLAALLVQVMTSTGQTASPIDSFTRVVQKHSARDSNRVMALVKLADATIYTDPATAMRYADEALGIAQESHWVKGIALSWRQKGNAYYYFSDNPAAMDCYIKGLNAARPLGIRELDASLLNNLANIYSDNKQYDKALDYYRQFLDNAKDMRSERQEAIALVNMGTVYTELGQLDKALESGRLALEICRRNGLSNFIPIVLNNLGVAYNKEGKTDSALVLYRRSIDSAERSGNNDAK